MPRKRIIDPEVWTHKRMLKIPVQTRYLYLALVSLSDDFGWIDGDPLFLKANIFPVDNINTEQIIEMIKQLTTVGLIQVFQDDSNGIWLKHPDWEDHQHIQKRFGEDKSNWNMQEVTDQYYTDTIPVLYRYNTDTKQVPYKSSSSINKNRIEKNRIEKNINTNALNDKKPSRSEPSSKNIPKIIFNFEKRKWENITSEDKKSWEEAYPACDVVAELAKMADWLISNPKKRKKNYRRFITNWLSRQQDRGGTKVRKLPQETPKPAYYRRINDE